MLFQYDTLNPIFSLQSPFLYNQFLDKVPIWYYNIFNKYHFFQFCIFMSGIFACAMHYIVILVGGGIVFGSKRQEGIKASYIESLSSMSDILCRLTGQYAAFYVDCLKTGEFDPERAKKEIDVIAKAAGDIREVVELLAEDKKRGTFLILK